MSRFTLPRLPLIPTIVVGLAIAAMIALGVWQLQRRAEKNAALVLYAANPAKPVMDFPRLPVGDENLFRRATAMCLEVVGWQTQGGRSAGGATGWRSEPQAREHPEPQQRDDGRDGDDDARSHPRTLARLVGSAPTRAAPR